MSMADQSVCVSLHSVSRWLQYSGPSIVDTSGPQCTYIYITTVNPRTSLATNQSHALQNYTRSPGDVLIGQPF